MIWEAGQLVSPIKQEGKVGGEEEEDKEEEEKQIISRKKGRKAIFVCGLLSSALSLPSPLKIMTARVQQTRPIT